MYYWQLSQQDDDTQRFHFDTTRRVHPLLLVFSFQFGHNEAGQAPSSSHGSRLYMVRRVHPLLAVFSFQFESDKGLPLLVLFPSLATTIAAMLTTTPNPVYATTIHDDTLCNLPQPDPPEHEKRAKSVFFLLFGTFPLGPFSSQARPCWPKWGQDKGAILLWPLPLLLCHTMSQPWLCHHHHPWRHEPQRLKMHRKWGGSWRARKWGGTLYACFFFSIVHFILLILCNLPQLDPPEHENRAQKRRVFFVLLLWVRLYYYYYYTY